MSQRRPSLGAIFLTIFLDLLGFGLVMPFLALEAREHFGIGEGSAALLGAIYSLMQFVFMPVWGRLSDRVGRRPVLLASVFASALSMFALGSALAFATSVLWLFVARAAGGAATANIGTASAYIADITKPEERVRGMALIGVGFGLGFTLGPALGGVLAGFQVNGRSGPMACYVAAGLSVLNLLWVLVGLPESLPKERRSKGARSLSPLNTDAFKYAFGDRLIAPAILVNFLVILAFSMMEQTYAFLAEDGFGFDEDNIGWLFGFMGVIAILTQGGFMRRVSGKIPEATLIRWGSALQMVGFAGLVIAPSLHVAGLWIGSTLLAVGNGMTQPSMSAYISRQADPDRQGEALSTNQSMSSMARVLGPSVGGAAYQGLQMQAPFALGALFNAGALFIAQYLVRGDKTSMDKRAGTASADEQPAIDG